MQDNANLSWYNLRDGRLPEIQADSCFGWPNASREAEDNIGLLHSKGRKQAGRQATLKEEYSK
jgi:hypothetical protein